MPSSTTVTSARSAPGAESDTVTSRFVQAAATETSISFSGLLTQTTASPCALAARPREPASTPWMAMMETVTSGAQPGSAGLRRISDAPAAMSRSSAYTTSSRITVRSALPANGERILRTGVSPGR